MPSPVKPLAPQQSVAPIPDGFHLPPPSAPTSAVSPDPGPAVAGSPGSTGAEASLAAPAPVAPRHAVRPVIGDVQACAPQSDDYPLAVRRAGAAGCSFEVDYVWKQE